MATPQYSVLSGAQSAISANKVLKNTYMLLSATLAFSAVMALISMSLALPGWMYLASVIGAFIMGVMNNGMSIMGIGIDYQQVIKGLVLLAAVCVDVYNKNK